MPRKPRVRREDLAPGASLCDHCTGKCCRYFSLPIETPTTWDDYDSVRWYLAHGQTLVYVEKGTWYLVVLTRCQYLDVRNHCRIYHDRPKICRDYTTEECEYDEDWVFTKVFESPEQIWEYAEALLPARKRPRGSAPSAGPLLELGPPPVEPRRPSRDNRSQALPTERS